MALPNHVSVRANMSMSREITRSETDIALFLTERTLMQCTFNLATFTNVGRFHLSVCLVVVDTLRDSVKVSVIKLALFTPVCFTIEFLVAVTMDGIDYGVRKRH